MKEHEAHQAFGDASASWWQEKEDRRGRWMKTREDPSLVLNHYEMHYLNDLDGKDVCVLGSGDNEAALALTGPGGCVTSVDISERRYAIASERADTLGLHLSFVQADVTDLSVI